MELLRQGSNSTNELQSILARMTLLRHGYTQYETEPACFEYVAPPSGGATRRILRIAGAKGGGLLAV